MITQLIDYEFGYGEEDIGDVVKRVVRGYNERHLEPANMVWVCRGDYDELMVREKNGVGIGWNPCSRERGNVMVGRVAL